MLYICWNDSVEKHNSECRGENDGMLGDALEREREKEILCAMALDSSYRQIHKGFPHVSKYKYLSSKIFTCAPTIFMQSSTMLFMLFIKVFLTPKYMMDSLLSQVIGTTLIF